MNSLKTLAITASLVSFSATIVFAADTSSQNSVSERDKSYGIPYGDDYIEIDEPKIDTPANQPQIDKAKAAGQLSLTDELDADVAANELGFELEQALTPLAPPMAGDLNGDFMVNLDDLLLVINNWGPCQNEASLPSIADISPEGGNCMVDFDDILVVLLNWGM